MKISLDTSGKMLSTLGTRDFGQSLMAAAHELIGADYRSLFVFDEDRAPVCLATNGVRSNRLAAFAGEKYANTHWKADPIVELKVRRRADVLFVPGLSQEFSSGAYRQDCIETLNIGDRITFLFGNDAHFLRLSFYRFSFKPAFGETEISVAHDSADFFRSTITRHHSLISRAGMDNLRMFPSRQAMRKRLISLNPSLSPREVDVCAMILQGVSSEGIALEIGISKTSVVTYRKRPYTKLGITTQSELFATCLSMH